MSLDLIPGKFYVVDTMAGSLSAGVVPGPHDDKAAAERDRLDCNIADDCIVRRVPYRVPLCNVQTLGASAGYGFGKTKEEAIVNAIAEAQKTDKNARYNPQTNTVDFRGGANC